MIRPQGSTPTVEHFLKSGSASPKAALIADRLRQGYMVDSVSRSLATQACWIWRTFEERLSLVVVRDRDRAWPARSCSQGTHVIFAEPGLRRSCKNLFVQTLGFVKLTSNSFDVGQVFDARKRVRMIGTETARRR